jgi:copper oxidase (laccase) domain-containing protein
VFGTQHSFFGRRGGVSSEAFASLNCSYGKRDAAENVCENRRRVAACVGVHPEKLLFPRLYHSPEVNHTALYLGTVVIVQFYMHRSDFVQ